jgi:Peptidase M15.
MISKNFTLEEFTASATAKAKGITNVPSTQQVINLCALVHHVLQPLRDAMGHEVR